MQDKQILTDKTNAAGLHNIYLCSSVADLVSV